MIHHIPYLFLVHEKIAPKVRQRKYRKRKRASDKKNMPHHLLTSKQITTFAVENDTE